MLKISDLEVSDSHLRKLLGNFEKDKENMAQGESEMKSRINQLLGMLREAEETAVREAAYHERVVTEIQRDLDLAHRRLEELESVNVSDSSQGHGSLNVTDSCVKTSLGQRNLYLCSVFVTVSYRFLTDVELARAAWAARAAQFVSVVPCHRAR